MNIMTRSGLSKFLFGLLVLAFAPSCASAATITSTQDWTTEKSVDVSLESAAQPAEIAEWIKDSDPLDTLLELRSVIIQLTVRRPDKSGGSTRIEIDALGNLHLTVGVESLSSAEVPAGMNAPETAGSYEIFVLGGKAYAPFNMDPGWMAAPFSDDFGPALSGILHGVDSPALWLDILPEGSLVSAGKDAPGGFDADRYTVNGIVDGQAITGNLWYDVQSGALLKAELHVPAALYDVTGESTTGELVLELDTQMAEVAPITLPEKPAESVE